MIIIKILKKIYFFFIIIIRKSKIISFFDNFKSFKNSHFRSLFFLHDFDEMLKKDYIWINYKSKKLLSDLINKNFDVLEYGSGASTFWFSKRVKKIYTIEHNFEWFRKIDKIKRKNVKPYFVKSIKKENSKYKSKILKNFCFKNYVYFPKKINKKFDLIFIDGRCRDQCIYLAYKFLTKKKSIIVLDNSSRFRYQLAIKWLAEKSYKVINLNDYVPTLPYKEQTTFFYVKR